MSNSESSNVVVDRLLHCLQQGLSPPPASHYRVKSRQAVGSPRSPMGRSTSGSCIRTDQGANTETNETGHADGFVTPDLKSSQLKPWTKEVSPGVFYGSPAGKFAKKQPQVLRLLHEIRRDLAAEGYSVSRDAIWATFGKQDQAMQFIRGHGSRDIALFVYQDHLSGQRRFLATTYKEFWCRYDAMPQEQRHHYEIITEGSPCHMYFDLEFDREANAGLDGNALVDLLLSHVAEMLCDVYSLGFNPAWTVELDSTTEGKFSRHIILRIPHVAFKDNSHVGAFVAELCSRLDIRRQTDERVNDLYVVKGQSRKECCTQLFVDQAVYSRNRSFRLPFSSKAGKRCRLVPSGRFCCRDKSEREIFEDSLICRVDPECERLLTFGSELAGHGGSVYAGTALGPSISQKAAEFCISGRSPFPAVDMFIESIACIEGIPGKIRSWYWFSDYSVLVYNIIGNRYCENIGRQHKSNHVMYIVDFRTAGYYQKCHDPDCRGYKSPLRPIPRDTIPPDFPLLASLESCYNNLEASMGEDECSVGNFSQLSIARDTHSSNESLTFGEGCQVEGDENAWWEEVFDSMENMGVKPSTTVNEQRQGADKFLIDDDWWERAQHELEMQGF